LHSFLTLSYAKKKGYIMKFFLDTANFEALNKAKKTGLIQGVTTNPTHLSKEGEGVELVKKIAALLPNCDISVEVTEKTPEAIYNQAKEIANLAPNIVVKIPCYNEYVPVIHTLVQEGIPLNITLLFSVVQGLCMAKLQVKYISPFIGRLDDIDTDGMQLVQDLRTILDTYCFKTQILAASLRSIPDIHQAALAGADIATLPVTIYENMLDHPLTDKGMKLFDQDWQKLGIKKFP
jgi:transaldolase